MFPTSTADGWQTRDIQAAARDHLISLFESRYPQAAETAPFDAVGAIRSLPDVEVIEDPHYRSHGCPLDGTYDPDPPLIRYRPYYNRRDGFTLLHEVGHHLLATDDNWCLRIWPMLNDVKGLASRVEEDLVNAFAAGVLIDTETAQDAFARGVTSTAIAVLYESTGASATACLVRGLREPGDRLVMLCGRDGLTLFAASNGEPYNPGAGVTQPAVATAVERIGDLQGTCRIDGGDGVRYRSGKAFTRVRFDVTVRDHLVFVIVEPTSIDTRVQAFDEWHLTCTACGHSFTQDASPGLCNTCREPFCPRCLGCDCDVQAAKLCQRCFITLSKARAGTGATICEDCCQGPVGTAQGRS